MLIQRNMCNLKGVGLEPRLLNFMVCSTGAIWWICCYWCTLFWSSWFIICCFANERMTRDRYSKQVFPGMGQWVRVETVSSWGDDRCCLGSLWKEIYQWTYCDRRSGASNGSMSTGSPKLSKWLQMLGRNEGRYGEYLEETAHQVEMQSVHKWNFHISLYNFIHVYTAFEYFMYFSFHLLYTV